MDKKIGFIGSGNMGGAIIGGMVKAGLTARENILASSTNSQKLERLKERYGIRTFAGDNKAVAAEADILFLTVKPNIYRQVIAEVKDLIKKEAVIVAVAAGKSIADIERDFGFPVKVIRAMPNTPSLVGEGMTAICKNQAAAASDLQDVQAIFASFGKVELIKESLIDAVIGASGSSPAIVYLFIEALADGAVQAGMPRSQAYTFAAQAVLGSAKMVLESGLHPGELKDMVCSPGGTSIRAVTKAEEMGLRAATIAAVEAAVEKSIAMNRESSTN